MELLFRVWRFVILLALGNAFLVECTVIFDPHIMEIISKPANMMVLTKHDKASEVLPLLTALVFYLAIMGAVGVFFLDVIGAGVSSAAKKLVRYRSAAPLIYDSISAGLFAPYEQLATAFLHQHKRSLAEHIDLINVGLDQFKTNQMKLRGYQARVVTHLSRDDLAALIEPANFHWIVTQDQFRAERLRDEINSIAVLWIIGPALLIAEVRNHAAFMPLVASAVAVLSILALTTPALAARRRRFAAVQMVGYLSQFQLSEADVADRSM